MPQAQICWGFGQRPISKRRAKSRSGIAQPEREVIAPFDPPRKAPEASDSQFDAAAVLALLKDASPEDGARLFRMCMPCHAGEKGAPHRIGSNLWGIVGSRKAAHPDYRYSAALKAKGGTWSYRELAEYLHNPRTFAPGTSMSFAGMTDNRKIADLLVYLRTLSGQSGAAAQMSPGYRRAPAMVSSMTVPRISTMSSTSRSVTMNGGASRMWSPALPSSVPPIG